MTPVDYIVIVAYLIFVLSLGPVYQRFSKTASDFFRGGGGMLWWMVGASAWVMTFSAWTFTGGAGKAYEAGVFFLLLSGANVFGLIFTYLFTAARFRQMRIITPVEAVRKRFGRVNEQFFTWLPVPFGIIFGGIGLYAIAIFMSVVFNASIPMVVVTLGIVVTVMAALGGSWAVVASDFVQMLMILTIAIVMAVLVLAMPEVGGMSGFIEKVPPELLDPTDIDRPGVLVIFIIGLLITQTVMPNSLMEGAQKFIYVKNGLDAKKALIISMVGTAIIMPVFILPAMAARVVVPDLTSQYPGLTNPAEAAYVAVALKVLPSGMLGLLVCGIFAATMSSMDTGLNRAAGILVRNFYLPVINPEASEGRQITIGKLLSAVLGLAQIITGLTFAQFRTLPLFDLILLMSATIALPSAVPLFFGIFIKRTPSWAGWSTVLVGFSMFLVLRGADLMGIPALLSTENLQALAGLLGWSNLNQSEVNDLTLAFTSVINFTVCLIWFLGTIPFWKRTPERYKENVDHFFKEMRTPVDMEAEGVAGWNKDKVQYHVMGMLCMTYGIFVTALALLPNPLWGRACFVFCGGSVGLLGLVLWRISKRDKPNYPPRIDGGSNRTPSAALAAGDGSSRHDSSAPPPPSDG